MSRIGDSKAIGNFLGQVVDKLNASANAHRGEPDVPGVFQWAIRAREYARRLRHGEDVRPGNLAGLLEQAAAIFENGGSNGLEKEAVKREPAALEAPQDSQSQDEAQAETAEGPSRSATSLDAPHVGVKTGS